MSNTVVDSQFIKDAQNLCQDPDTEDFDLEAGKTWIYPTNYPVREYQYNITEQALHKNTLVSLPTGLGKTFIAAVVMFNFYRWYPHGKIIFMAPTRPLVKQQIDACYSITAIPQEATTELTGSKQAVSRLEIWQNKRVFFITPQVLQNDLDNIPELANKIKCVVFDEAHRAKGNHAYCDVIRKLVQKNKLFRVLALSATPGNSVKDVLEIMRNLLIAHLEFKTEESLDVKPYVFERSLETVVVPFGEKILEVKNEYMQILEKYTRILMNFKIIHGNCANLTKGKMFLVLKDFQSKNKSSSTPNYNEILKSLHICVSLYHAYELLTRHGLRSFLNFFEEHINDVMLRSVYALRPIMEDLEKYLGPDPTNISQLPDGTFTEIPSSAKFGHPKFYYLRDILKEHFRDSDKTSRVIVFFEYRGSVKEAFALLIQSEPLIRPKVFLGQGSGMTQKSQINVVKSFREGTCNTLLSTCIGEEGLDVGDVDLIVCFDVSNKSPIRMIQRMGRTGRKKQGRVIVLVTEGKEQQILKDCLIHKSNLGTFVLNSHQLVSGLNPNNPSMIPTCIKPQCQKMHISVKKPVLTKKNKNIKGLLRYMSHEDGQFDDMEIVEFSERLNSKPQVFCNAPNPLSIELVDTKLNFEKHLEKQRQYQSCGKIKHSKQTEILVSLLQFADSKRFNLPTTEVGGEKNLKQGNIRDMFLTKTSLPSSQDSVLSTQSDILENDFANMFSTELFTELSDYLTIQSSLEPCCFICEQFFNCFSLYNNVNYKTTNNALKDWIQPDDDIVDNITADDFEIFERFLNPEYAELHKSLDEDADIFENFEFPPLEEEEKIAEEKSFAYEEPKSFKKMVESFRISDSQQRESITLKTNDISDSKIAGPLNKSEYDSILKFFHLNALNDLFSIKIDTATVDLDKTIIYSPELKCSDYPSPDLFQDSPETKNTSTNNISDAESPILCSYDRIRLLKSKAKKKLFSSTKIYEGLDACIKETNRKPNLSILKQPHKSFLDSPRAEVAEKQLDITTKVARHENTNINVTPERINESKAYQSELLDISDICDLSQFGLSSAKNKTSVPLQQPENYNVRVKHTDLEINDICDLSTFGISANKPGLSDKPVPTSKNIAHQVETKYDISTNLLDIEDICDISSFIGSIPKTDTINSQTAGSKGSFNLRNVDKDKPSPLEKANLGDFPPESTIEKTSDSNAPTKQIPATPSQMSVTQMLNYIETPKTPSSTPKLENKRRRILSLKQTVTPTGTLRQSGTKKNEDSYVKKKSFLNISLASNSDEEFEDVHSSPIFVKPKIASPSLPKQTLTRANKSKKKVTNKRLHSEFIEHEATVSDEHNVSEDEDSDEDCYEASFIANETVDFPNTQMHAEYLKSVKSPTIGMAGKFKIQRNPKHNITNVFSQAVNDEDNTYMNDSFCVHSDNSDVSEDAHELSELEILEMKLRQRERNKRRNRPSEDQRNVAKRKRIIEFSDESD